MQNTSKQILKEAFKHSKQILKEAFKHSKEAIRSHKPKDRQYNGEKRKEQKDKQRSIRL
jgi:cell division septum initiation protein DivIVA